MKEDYFSGLSLTAQEQYLIAQEILEGIYGQPGRTFLTTRELAQQRKVSLVTAQRIMVRLRDQKLIELRGKRYYLNHGEQKKEKDIVEKVIGMIVPNIGNSFFGLLAKAAKKLALEQGYRVLVMDTDYQLDQEKTALELFRHFGVAGILSSPGPSRNILDYYQKYSLPCVFTSHGIEEIGRAIVKVTPILVTQKIVRHLLDEGYRNFVYFGSNVRPLINDERYIGFYTSLLQEGFALKEENVTRLSGNTKSTDLIIEEILKNQKTPVAVFCYHDLFAAEVIQVCHHMGLRIPEDVGIVGFDDLTIAKNLYPTLTTVSYRIQSLADIALQLLRFEIDGQKRKKDIFHIEPSLVIRQSTNLTQKKLQLK